MIVENVRSKDLRAGDRIVSGPNGGGSLDSYAFWTVERDEPEVPALPSEPYTVIRVTWLGLSGGGRVLMLDDVDMWAGVPGGRYTPPNLALSITGFEVLSEPRAVTAKAVLDRVDQELADPDGELPLAMLRREFGVDS